jgi:hypothetical protein
MSDGSSGFEILDGHEYSRAQDEERGISCMQGPVRMYSSYHAGPHINAAKLEITKL